jgi:site-specific DNA recombinase
MRAAIYTRVSTEEQAQRFGLSSQLAELRALAARRGFTVPHGAVFEDAGFSGATLERPALERLRETVRAGMFEVVLVHAPDRLSRDLVQQLVVLEEIRHTGTRVEFLTSPAGDGPEGRLLEQIQAVVGAFERAKIKERTMRGKREKARRGLIVAGPVPYGYRPDRAAPGRLVPDDDEASVVRMLFAWLVEEQRSIRSITSELRRLGVRPRRARAFAPSSVRRILTSELYAGRAHFNRRQRTGSQTAGVQFRPVAEWIAVPVPALIPDELFQRAQAQLAQNQAHLIGRPPMHPYLLRGLLRCGRCGRRLAGMRSHGKPFYRCVGRDHLRPAGTRCDAPTIAAGRIEALVWETVVGVLRQPRVLVEKLEAYRVTLGAKEVEVRSQADHLARQIAAAERQADKLLSLYLDDTLALPGLRERLEAIQRQRAELEQQHQRALERLARQHGAKERTATLRRFCRQALRGLGRLTLDGRQALLAALLDQVVLRGGAIELHGVLPGPWMPVRPRPARNRSESLDDRASRNREDDAGSPRGLHPAAALA